MADGGVAAIAGVGLAKLGKWCEASLQAYRTLIVRVQKMIVGVTLVEKEERKNDRTLQKALLGYDPEKWIKTDPEIRDEEQVEVEYQSEEPIQTHQREA